MPQCSQVTLVLTTPEDPEEMGQEHLVLQQLLAPPECLEMKDGAVSSKTTQATILQGFCTSLRWTRAQSPQPAPKWPRNRFGFAPALRGALPSTAFSLGTGSRAWCMGRWDNPISLAKQQPSPEVQYLTYRWSVNCSAAAPDTNNSRLRGREEVPQVLVKITL